MTGEVVNLRRLRKAKARAAEAAKGAENRALFGRTRAEREQSSMTASLAERRLDAHRLDGHDERADGDDTAS